jgi:hypothetical protein
MAMKKKVVKKDNSGRGFSPSPTKKKSGAKNVMKLDESSPDNPKKVPVKYTRAQWIKEEQRMASGAKPTKDNVTGKSMASRSQSLSNKAFIGKTQVGGEGARQPFGYQGTNKAVSAGMTRAAQAKYKPSKKGSR